ncbi:MAG: hypothetical protein A2Y76_11095 [Planctomycetes bacterium RBG_13_60_9]|nr:MAG: hypothetical protein A2Y76_11095 [Planctomycetes bacterium RBG_13_60_9]
MIRDEFSVPQQRSRHDTDKFKREVRSMRGKGRSWMLWLCVPVLLVLAGVVGMAIIDSSGIKARVLADVAGYGSESAGATSFVKGHSGASARSGFSVAACEKLVRLKPTDPSAHVLLGNAYADMGRTQEAVACYKEALTLDPDCFEAHLGMGKAHFACGAYPEAVASCQRALQLRPGSADAHLSLGLALSNAGKYDEAMQAFQRAKELDPAIVETQVLTGKAYLQAGMCAQAIECFKDAVQTDQQHAQAYFNLGRAYLRVGEKGLAIEQERILQDLDPRLASQLSQLINQ